MTGNTPDPIHLEAAERALRFIYQKPNELQFRQAQITVDAASFAFIALKKVDAASRIAAGLFKLWSPVPVRNWSQIPKAFAKAAKEALGDPATYKKSPAGATVAIVHRRNLQYHLNDPETFPCPQFR